ncbi:hypothetical protein IGB42_01665 [Andreprevotia sp. IGB-42]|uniref:hypothetical protein n=1 Tax=Andreprevotia sp. IGB-42 TaxID=2497473 RepID=UPI001356DCE3|nr:hypothetical protein [Andreprevotia sp. IGB-42]KAF0813986.1 hypothetical protein IGB42_01665 [Andreprevotia sp. IGB-42]
MLPANLQQLETIRDECKAMVTRRAGWSAGAALVPIPGIDVGTDVAVLLQLIPAINQRFGLSPAQLRELDPQIEKLVWVGISSVGSELAGRWISRKLVLRILQKMGVRVATKSVVRFIPLLGQAIAAGISFGAMKMVGNAHVEDCYQVAKRALLAAPAALLPAPGMITNES